MEIKPKSPVDFKKRFAIGSLICVVLAVAAVLLVIRQWDSSANQRYQAAVAKSKEDGAWIEKVSEAYQPTTEGKTAALKYAQAFNLLDATKNKYLLARSLLSPADVQEFTRQRALRAKALDMIAIASAGPAPDFNHDYASGLESYPEYSGFKEAEHWFCLSAIQEATLNHPDQVVSNLRIAAHLAAHVGRAPLAIAKLVQIALDSIFFVTIEDIVTLKPGIAPELLKVLPELGPPPDFAQAFRVESIEARNLLAHPIDLAKFSRTDDGEPQSTGITGHGLNLDRQAAWFSLFPWARRSWLASYINLHRQYLVALNTKGMGKDQLLALDAISSLRPSSDTPEGWALDLCLLEPSGEARLLTQDLARRALTKAGLELISQGPSSKWQSPTELDPFDGRPLRFKPKGNSFRIYAIGLSGKDHGGVRLGPKTSPLESDVVFDFPFVPTAPPIRLKPARSPAQGNQKGVPLRFSSAPGIPKP